MVMMMSMMMSRKRNYSRSKNGYALLVTLLIGLIATTFLLATSALLVPLLNSERMNKSRDGLTDAAEMGLDYAIKELNDAYIEKRVSNIDAPLTEPERVSDLPSLYIPEPSAGIGVKIRVTRPDMELIESTDLYDVTYDPRKNKVTKRFGEVQNSSLFSTNYYRIIEVTAKSGTLHSSIRAIIKPDVKMSYVSNTPAPTPLFPAPLFANTSLTLNLNGTTIAPGDVNGTQLSSGNFVDSSGSMNLKLQSNGKMDIGKNGTIYGDINITNPEEGAPAKVLTAGTNSLTRVWGRATANSSIDIGNIEYREGNGLPFTNTLSNDNIYGFGEFFKNSAQFLLPGAQGRTGVNKTPVTNTSVPSTTTNPLPTSPSYSQTFPAFPPPVPSQQPSQQPPPTNVAPGIYTTSSLDSTGAGNVLNLVGSASPSSMWALHLMDGDGAGTATSNSNAVLLNTSKIAQSSNMRPSQLQIFYSGERPIEIKVDNSSFKAMIYAPRAKVTFTGTGKFIGSVVGNDVYTSVPMILVTDPEGKSSPSILMTNSPSGNVEPSLYNEATPKRMPFKLVSLQYVKSKALAYE